MEKHEVRILHSLVNNIVDLLEQRRDSAPRDELAEFTGMRSGHQAPPDSAALARLLPDFRRPGSTSEADSGAGGGRQRLVAENSAMRMLHEPEIIDSKLADAEVVLGTLPSRGGSVSLTSEQADSWLGCLNDLRLGLGAMIAESAPDGQGEIPEHLVPSDPRAPHLEVYHWLTFMQDSLCTALIGE